MADIAATLAVSPETPVIRALSPQHIAPRSDLPVQIPSVRHRRAIYARVGMHSGVLGSVSQESARNHGKFSHILKHIQLYY